MIDGCQQGQGSRATEGRPLLRDIAAQLRQVVARDFEGTVEVQTDDAAARDLIAAVNELLESARRSTAQTRAAFRERDTLDGALMELEARMAEEIVAHEKTTRDMQQQRAALRNVVDSLPYSIFWRDREGVYLGANENKLRALGLASLDQLVGKTAYDTGVSREEADFYRQVDRQVMETGEPIFNLEEIQQRPDGPHVLLISKVPLRDDAGMIIGILGMYVDVTRRRHIAASTSEGKDGDGSPRRPG